jgi:hypothetical protein
MPAEPLDRLETRVKKETKHALRIFCAVNNITIQEGVELALSKLPLPKNASEVMPKRKKKITSA